MYNSIKIWAKDLTRYLSKRNHIDENVKRCSTSAVLRKEKIETALRYYHPASEQSGPRSVRVLRSRPSHSLLVERKRHNCTGRWLKLNTGDGASSVGKLLAVQAQRPATVVTVLERRDRATLQGFLPNQPNELQVLTRNPVCKNKADGMCGGIRPKAVLWPLSIM